MNVYANRLSSLIQKLLRITTVMVFIGFMLYPQHILAKTYSFQVIPNTDKVFSCHTMSDHDISKIKSKIDSMIQRLSDANENKNITENYPALLFGEAPFGFYISPALRPEQRAFIEKLVSVISGIRLTSSPLASINVLDYDFVAEEYHVMSFLEQIPETDRAIALNNKDTIIKHINDSINHELFSYQKQNKTRYMNIIPNSNDIVIKESNISNKTFKLLSYTIFPKISEHNVIPMTQLFLPEHTETARQTYLRNRIYNAIVPYNIDLGNSCSNTTSLTTSIVRKMRGINDEGFSLVEIYIIENYLKFKGGIDFYLMLKKDLENKNSEFYKRLVQ